MRWRSFTLLSLPGRSTVLHLNIGALMVRPLDTPPHHHTLSTTLHQSSSLSLSLSSFNKPYHKFTIVLVRNIRIVVLVSSGSLMIWAGKRDSQPLDCTSSLLTKRTLCYTIPRMFFARSLRLVIFWSCGTFNILHHIYTTHYIIL